MTDVEITPNFTGFDNAKYAFTLFPTRRIANTDMIEIRFAPQILLSDGNPLCSIVSLAFAFFIFLIFNFFIFIFY